MNYERKPIVETPIKELSPRYGNIPQHLVDGLVLYVREKIRPGHFLCACLSNDFIQACGRADYGTRQYLPEIAQLIFNELPSTCWGSEQIVNDWVASRTKLPDIEEVTRVLVGETDITNPMVKAEHE